VVVDLCDHIIAIATVCGSEGELWIMVAVFVPLCSGHALIAWCRLQIIAHL